MDPLEGAAGEQLTPGGRALRVLTVATSYPRHRGDAAGRFVRDLNAGLRALGHGVSTLAPWAPGLPEEEADAEAGVVRRVRPRDERSAGLFYGAGAEENAGRLGLFRTVRDFRDWTRCFRAALAGVPARVDVVLAHWVFPVAWWAVCAGAPQPVVGVVHGADARFLLRPVAGRVAARGLDGRLAGLVCVSTRARERVAARLGVASDRVIVTPMGVDGGIFAPGPSSMRHERLVVAAGRLVPAKGFDDLVRACRGLDVRLAIAGDGPARGALAQLALVSGVAIDLPGVLAPPDLAALFRRARVVAIPGAGGPDGEGTPMVALEALACGAAVVGVPSGGLPDILPPHALAPAHALRDVLEDALRDPDRYRDPGAASAYDRVAVARRVAGVLTAAAGERRP